MNTTTDPSGEDLIFITVALTHGEYGNLIDSASSQDTSVNSVIRQAIKLYQLQNRDDLMDYLNNLPTKELEKVVVDWHRDLKNKHHEPWCEGAD